MTVGSLEGEKPTSASASAYSAWNRLIERINNEIKDEDLRRAVIIILVELPYLLKA